MVLVITLAVGKSMHFKIYVHEVYFSDGSYRKLLPLQTNKINEYLNTVYKLCAALNDHPIRLYAYKKKKTLKIKEYVPKLELQALLESMKEDLMEIKILEMEMRLLYIKGK